MAQNYLLIILIVSIILLYCQYYCSYRNDFKITQTYLHKVDFAILQDKYPIVIYDKVIEPRELLKTLFAYTYALSAEYPIMFSGRVVINLSKYIIIYNQLTDVDIEVIHPRFRKIIKFEISPFNKKILQSKDDLSKINLEYITVKLKKNQVLILPNFWMFTSVTPLQTIFIDDVFSYLVNATYKKLLL